MMNFALKTDEFCIKYEEFVLKKMDFAADLEVKIRENTKKTTIRIEMFWFLLLKAVDSRFENEDPLLCCLHEFWISNFWIFACAPLRDLQDDSHPAAAARSEIEGGQFF